MSSVGMARHLLQVPEDLLNSVVIWESERCVGGIRVKVARPTDRFGLLLTRQPYKLSKPSMCHYGCGILRARLMRLPILLPLSVRKISAG